MVADDDHSIRQLVYTIVRREGVEVDCVSDGQEAIDQLQRHEYAIILLDLMMPRVDGFGVIEWLKNHPQSTKPVVLVITAYADQRFKEVDPDMVAGVLRKPFDVIELGNLVRLCAGGSIEAHRRLMFSRDATIRELARRHIPDARAREGNGNGHGDH